MNLEEVYSGFKPSVEFFGCFAALLMFMYLILRYQSWRTRALHMDVIFEKNKSCDCDKIYKDQLIVDLEWGDDEDGSTKDDVVNDANEVKSEEVDKVDEEMKILLQILQLNE